MYENDDIDGDVQLDDNKAPARHLLVIAALILIGLFVATAFTKVDPANSATTSKIKTTAFKNVETSSFYRVTISEQCATGERVVWMSGSPRNDDPYWGPLIKRFDVQIATFKPYGDRLQFWQTTFDRSTKRWTTSEATEIANHLAKVMSAGNGPCRLPVLDGKLK